VLLLFCGDGSVKRIYLALSSLSLSPLSQKGEKTREKKRRREEEKKGFID